MSCCRSRSSRPELRLLSRSISNASLSSSSTSARQRASFSTTASPPTRQMSTTTAMVIPRRFRTCSPAHRSGLPPQPPPSCQQRRQQTTAHFQRRQPQQQQQQRSLHSTPRRDSGFLTSLADTVRQVMPKTVKSYQHYGLSQRLAQACMAQAEYTVDRKKIRRETIEVTETGEHIGEGSTVWHRSFNLLPTFSTWASITFLHAYLLSTRIRALSLPEDEVKTLIAGMVDTIFYDMEAAMDQKHRLTSSMARQRFLKQYFEVWRGTMISYDEGLVKGDAVLAAALWRNVFKAREGEDGRKVEEGKGEVVITMDVRHLAMMVAYVRCVLAEMDRLGDEEFMGGLAETTFGKGITGAILTGAV